MLGLVRGGWLGWDVLFACTHWLARRPRVRWVALCTHANDASIATASMATAAWPVEGATEAFRHFRILQTGKNAYGDNLLLCAGIELYGAFRGPAA